MKIGIVGAGAMGSVYGRLFARAGHDVWLVDIWREHIEAIRRNGLHVTGASGERTLKPAATCVYRKSRPTIDVMGAAEDGR